MEIPYKWLLKTDAFIHNLIKKNQRDLRKVRAQDKKEKWDVDVTAENFCQNMWHKTEKDALDKETKDNAPLYRAVMEHAITLCKKTLIDRFFTWDEKLHDQCIKDGGFPISFSEVDHRLKITEKGDIYQNWIDIIGRYRDLNEFEFIDVCRNQLEKKQEEYTEDELNYRVDQCLDGILDDATGKMEKALKSTFEKYLEEIDMGVERINTKSDDPEFCLYPSEETPHRLATVVGLVAYGDDFSYAEGSYPYYFFNQWFDKANNYYTKYRKPSKKLLDEFVKDQWKTIFEYANSSMSNMKNPRTEFWDEYERINR